MLTIGMLHYIATTCPSQRSMRWEFLSVHRSTHVATQHLVVTLLFGRKGIAFWKFLNSELSKNPWVLIIIRWVLVSHLESMALLSLQALFQTSPHSPCYHGPPTPQSTSLALDPRISQRSGCGALQARWNFFADSYLCFCNLGTNGTFLG